ncbi:MAG: glycosyltransferase family 4 protein [Longimicrobiaceae bacterium]
MKLLLIGEEHVRDKVARHYEMLSSRGIETHYYVDDRSGITRELQARRPMRVRYAPNPSRGVRAVLAYWRHFRAFFDEIRPDVLEIYTSINFMVLLPMALYARLRGVHRVLVSRGELYPPEMEQTAPHLRFCLVRLLKISSLIISKETYIDEQLDRLAPGVPRFRWSNAIPVHGEPEYARQGNDVLFLNLFKYFRNLDVIVRSAARVKAAVPDVRFLLVGGTSGEMEGRGKFFDALAEYERSLQGLIAEEGVGDFVQILPFTQEVQPYFERAKVYLLPADLVFCNYALLEAMERGVPPVVSAEKDPAARLIVEDGVNGRVVPIDSAALADAVVELLQDEERRRALAAAARRTVVERYNLDLQADALAGAYRRLAQGLPPVEGSTPQRARVTHAGDKRGNRASVVAGWAPRPASSREG